MIAIDYNCLLYVMVALVYGIHKYLAVEFVFNGKGFKWYYILNTTIPMDTLYKKSSNLFLLGKLIRKVHFQNDSQLLTSL